MKELPLKYRFPAALLVSTLLCGLAVLLYRLGAGVDVVILLPGFIGLTFLNYRAFNKPIHYILMQAYVLVCMACSSGLCTYLYGRNVSGDPVTPIVGGFIIICLVVIATVTTVVTALVKAEKIRTKKLSLMLCGLIMIGFGLIRLMLGPFWHSLIMFAFGVYFIVIDFKIKRKAAEDNGETILSADGKN